MFLAQLLVLVLLGFLLLRFYMSRHLLDPRTEEFLTGIGVIGFSPQRLIEKGRLRLHELEGKLEKHQDRMDAAVEAERNAGDATKRLPGLKQASRNRSTPGRDR